MKKLFIVITLLVLISYYFLRSSGIRVRIENNSSLAITNVRVTTSEQLQSLEFDRIESNKNVTKFLKMKDNQNDGNYILEFDRPKGNRIIYETGYYTNGGALDDEVLFKVENDTVMAKFNDYGEY